MIASGELPHNLLVSLVRVLAGLSLGLVSGTALALIAACSVFTAPLGVRAAHALPVQGLKRVFASILLLLAATMLYKGLAG